MSASRVYLEGEVTVAHILPWYAVPFDGSEKSLCGRTAWPGKWLGQAVEEREKATGLKVCVRCRSMLLHGRT